MPKKLQKMAPIELCDEDIERVAIALSMADPDERGLPEGYTMVDFYTKLAKVAISAYLDKQYPKYMISRC